MLVTRWSAGSSSNIVCAMGSVSLLLVSEDTNASQPRYSRSARITRNCISRARHTNTVSDTPVDHTTSMIANCFILIAQATESSCRENPSESGSL